MNKKFSTLAALLLASGAGYTLVQAALESQTVFKPGIRYVIADKPVPNAAAANALAVTVDAGGVKVAVLATSPVDFGADAVWKVSELTTVGTFGLTFEGSYLSKDFKLTKNTAEALPITLDANNAVKVGDKFLSIADGLLGLGDKADMCLYQTDVNTKVTALGDVVTSEPIVLAKTEIVWTTASKLMKGGTVLSSTWSATPADNTPWTLAADGKISGVGATFLVAGAPGAPAGATAIAAAGSTLTMAEGGALMINGLYLETVSSGNATICNTNPTTDGTNVPLYLYNVTDGVISAAYEKTMPTAAGNYMIAPALTTTAISANGYVTATAASTTLGVVAIGNVAVGDALNADWSVTEANKDSLYLKSEVGYLNFSVDANDNITYSVSVEPETKFAMTENSLISKLGADCYSLDVTTTTAAITKLATPTTTPTSGLSVLTDFAPVEVDETITNGQTATVFDNNRMVIGEANAGDYVYFIIGGKYVSVADNGSIEMLDAAPTTAAAARKASWIVDGSKNAATYKSVVVLENEPAKFLAVGASDMKATITTPFQLASKPSVFGYDAARLQITTEVGAGAKKGYLVSEKDAENNVTYSVQANPDVVTTTPVELALKLSGIQAPAATEVDLLDVVSARKQVTNWVAGEYYFLSDGDILVKSDGSATSADEFSGKITDEASLENVSSYLWKMSEIENTATGQWSYSFTNLESKGLLIVNSQKAFISNTPFKYADENGLVFKLNKDFLQVNSDKLVLSSYAPGTEVPTFGLYEAVNVTYATSDLNNKLGNSFTLGTKEVVEKSDLINQALRAINLTVKGQTAQYFVVASTLTIADDKGETGALSVKDNKAMLKDAEFVVVGSRQYGLEVATTGNGFAYATKKGSDLFDFDQDLPKDGLDKAQFTTEYSLALGASKIEDINSLIITQTINFGNGKVTVRPQVLTAEVENAAGVMEDKFFVVTMSVDSPTDWSIINFDGNNGVAKNYFDKAAFFATVGNVVGNNAGFIYGPAYLNTDLVVDPAKDYVHMNHPEGQWVIRYNAVATPDKAIGFWMYNRESSKPIFLGSSIYSVKDAAGNLTNKYYLVDQNRNPAVRDTIELAPATLCHARLGGYGHSLDATDSITFDKVNLATTAYRIGIKNGSFDGIAYIQNSAVHNNQLTVNIKDNDGLRFYLVPTDTVAYGLNKSGKKYWEVVAAGAPDSLRRVSYAIQERTTKRFVELKDGKLELNATKKVANEAQKFYFKEAADGQFMIVLADEGLKDGLSKIYANIGDASLHSKPIYDRDIADAFVLDTVGAPKYADILKNSKDNNDTTLVHINLYSVENKTATSSYMLTAGENQFLVEGVPSVLKATGGVTYPAADFDLVVDTAYVKRAGNTMPLYYLGMNGTLRKDTITPLHKNEKDENGHDVVCKHFAVNDSIAGKFLFAMYDSIYYATSKTVKNEDHCYHYSNTAHFARLRFVDAVHMKDTMYVQSSKVAPKDILRAGKVTSNIPANRQQDWLSGFSVTPELQKSVLEDMGVELANSNFGLFAFEVNPTNDKEYAIYSPATGLYVAYINGNVVMAPQASYYTMVKGNEGTLVDNETIETTEVSVIAGNGSVTIQNAAGKTVAISNILGQAIAQTVLTSDNATISVPAGIIVVAVEGEAAVKAIVK